jgi:GNAT superfamily N-acetyltransferase
MAAVDNMHPQQFGDLTLTYRSRDEGSRRPDHVIEAHHPDEGIVGKLSIKGTTSKVEGIEVDPDRQRQGIATAMWNFASPLKPRHSNDRTNAGNAWAKSVGGPLPRNEN